MRILLTGASGLLGGYLRRELAAGDHDVTSTWQWQAPSDARGRWVRMDCTDAEAVRRTLEEARPEAVIHASAYTSVDGCEREPSRSERLNVTASKIVAGAAARVGATCVFYSTDYVFPGTRGGYGEEDAKGPVNVYGRHKLQAEDEVRAATPNHLVIRVSVVYGHHPVRVDFVRWLLEGWKGGITRRVVTDQSNSPTYAGFAAEATRALLEKGERGTFHACGRGGISRFDFAGLVADVFDVHGAPLLPFTSKEFAQDAPRPADTSMDCSKVAPSKSTISSPSRTGVFSRFWGQAEQFPID